MYETQLNFVEFVALFRSFSLRARKDLRDLFGQLAITCRSQSDGSLRDFNLRPSVLRQASDATPQRIGNIFQLLPINIIFLIWAVPILSHSTY